MRLLKRLAAGFFLLLFAALGGTALWALWPVRVAFDGAPLLAAAQRYDVRILRDRFGVPHVYGKADPDVAYVCGQLRLEQADGSNREGAYWRYEVWLRERESELGSVTGGNGSIYAVRRSDYVEVDPRSGHDLALPYLMVQRGRRAVYEPGAHAFEKPSRDLEDEYRRKVRMFEHCWLILLEGGMLRDVPPLYRAQLVSHRVLRYGSGLLHAVLLGANVALVASGPVYVAALAGQAGFLLLAAARPGLPRYYALVTLATLTALRNYVRRGVPATWQAAEGTR